MVAKQAHPSNPLALAVLALLFERPMHPYEMASILKERHKHESIKLRYGSLYTVIDSLVALGFILAKSTKREGNRPERTVYSLTAAGRTELRSWMRDLLGEPVKEYPQFEAALCLMPVLPPDEVVDLLRERASRLRKQIAEIEKQFGAIGENFPPLFLVEGEYRLALMKTELSFVDGLLARIAKGWGPVSLWRGFHEDRKATLAKLYREFGGGPES